MDPTQTDIEIRKNLDKLKEDRPPIPSEEELSSRLQKLEGKESSTSSNKYVRLPYVKFEDEQVNDVIKQYSKEATLQEKLTTPVSDIEERLKNLKTCQFIIDKLDHIIKTGKLTLNDLNEHTCHVLEKYPTEVVLTVLSQLAESTLNHIMNKSAYLCGLVQAKADLINTFTYGPNPKTMAHILENSEFSLQIKANQRLLIVPLEDRQPSTEPTSGCKLCCTEIPPEIFEDEIVELFNYDTEIYEFLLIMDPVTEMSKGIAFITFIEKEYAEQAQQKLNDFEIRPGKKLKLHISEPKFSKLADFPFEENDGHICIISSPSKYCSCIEQILNQITSLRQEIEEKERIADTSKVDEAKKSNKMQYASHSLLLEQIEPDAESLKKIINASDYTVDIINSITLEGIVEINEKICPELKKKGKRNRGDKKVMFRQEDVSINGIYNIPAYPSGVEFVENEMRDCVKYLNDTLKTEDDQKAIIMAATAKWQFLLIHPFVDGNGRCSRAIFDAILLNRNFPWITIPTDDSTRYYEALKMAHETEDLTLLYRFVCRCVQRSLMSYLESLRS